MTAPAALLIQAQAEGVTLALAAPDRLKLSGTPDAVAKWAPVLRPLKLALLGLLTPQTPDPLAIREALDERAAIREFEGGEPREIAEREARVAMRIFDALVAMPAGDPSPARWVTLLLPGCDLAQAQATAAWRFPGRVLEVREHG